MKDSKAQDLAKTEEYAVLLVQKIAEAAKEIGDEELAEGDNIKHFMHALCTLAPLAALKNMTENPEINAFDNLDFNCFAVKLSTEYAIKAEMEDLKNEVKTLKIQ